eukprot:5760371-Alexandrium_andersonii.AAC.1
MARLWESSGRGTSPSRASRSYCSGLIAAPPLRSSRTPGFEAGRNVRCLHIAPLQVRRQAQADRRQRRPRLRAPPE